MYNSIKEKLPTNAEYDKYGKHDKYDTRNKSDKYNNVLVIPVYFIDNSFSENTSYFPCFVCLAYLLHLLYFQYILCFLVSFVSIIKQVNDIKIYESKINDSDGNVYSVIVCTFLCLWLCNETLSSDMTTAYVIKFINHILCQCSIPKLKRYDLLDAIMELMELQYGDLYFNCVAMTPPSHTHTPTRSVTGLAGNDIGTSNFINYNDIHLNFSFDSLIIHITNSPNNHANHVPNDGINNHVEHVNQVQHDG